MRETAVAAIREYLASTCALLQRTFPQGLPEEDYFPVLSILGEQMSNRSLASVISHFTGFDYAIVFNDVLRAQSTDVPRPEDRERVKRCLLDCGYAEWLAEPE